MIFQLFQSNSEKGSFSSFSSISSQSGHPEDGTKTHSKILFSNGHAKTIQYGLRLCLNLISVVNYYSLPESLTFTTGRKSQKYIQK